MLTFLYWCVLESGCKCSMSTDVMMVSCSMLMTKSDDTRRKNIVAFTISHSTPHNCSDINNRTSTEIEKVPQHNTSTYTVPGLDPTTCPASRRIVALPANAAVYIDKPGVCLARGPLRSWESERGPRSHTHTHTPLHTHRHLCQ
jgi:hypothetical protein